MSTSSAWRRAKGWPGWLLLAVAAIGLLTIGVARDSGPRTSEERVEDIAKRLACPICDGESVFESRNNASAAIRNDIKADVSAGLLSDDQILTSIEERYGEKVRLLPKATGVDSLVWILPVAAFVCASAGLVVAFRRWKRAADTVPTDDDRLLVDAALRDAGTDETVSSTGEGDDEP